MPFIGQQPITGAYHKLDSITTSTTATYNLQLNGGAYYPTSANHLLVSLNGVMQAPQDSFTVSGSQITFASALTSSDNIDFIMALGDVLDIGVPSDGTVNTSQLANSAVTDAKIASGISSSKLTGALPAIDGSALTGLGFTTAEADLTSVSSFTGLPSTWSVMHISWNDVTTTSSGQYRINLRVGGSAITSGYQCALSYRYSGGATSYPNIGGQPYSQGFIFWGSWGTGTNHCGNAVITRVDASNGTDYLYTATAMNHYKDYNTYGGIGHLATQYDGTGAVDGIDFIDSAGSFSSGKVRIAYH